MKQKYLYRAHGDFKQVMKFIVHAKSKEEAEKKARKKFYKKIADKLKCPIDFSYVGIVERRKFWDFITDMWYITLLILGIIIFLIRGFFWLIFSVIPKIIISSFSKKQGETKNV